MIKNLIGGELYAGQIRDRESGFCADYIMLCVIPLGDTQKGISMWIQLKIKSLDNTLFYCGQEKSDMMPSLMPGSCRNNICIPKIFILYPSQTLVHFQT